MRTLCSCVVFAPRSHKSVRPSFTASGTPLRFCPPSGECGTGPNRAASRPSGEASTPATTAAAAVAGCSCPVSPTQGPLPGEPFRPPGEPPFWGPLAPREAGQRALFPAACRRFPPLCSALFNMCACVRVGCCYCSAEFHSRLMEDDDDDDDDVGGGCGCGRAGVVASVDPQRQKRQNFPRMPL